LHDLLLRWLPRLTADGYAILVVQKHLGSDSLQRWLTDQGYPTERIASSSGYRILQTRAGAQRVEPQAP
jgi:16S rRNA (guanine1207-N2)-methyltransferase